MLANAPEIQFERLKPWITAASRKLGAAVTAPFRLAFT